MLKQLLGDVVPVRVEAADVVVVKHWRGSRSFETLPPPISPPTFSRLHARPLPGGRRPLAPPRRSELDDAGVMELMMPSAVMSSAERLEVGVVVVGAVAAAAAAVAMVDERGGCGAAWPLARWVRGEVGGGDARPVAGAPGVGLASAGGGCAVAVWLGPARPGRSRRRGRVRGLAAMAPARCRAACLRQRPLGVVTSSRQPAVSHGYSSVRVADINIAGVGVDLRSPPRSASSSAAGS